MRFRGSRHHVLDDEDAGTRLRAATDVPQDLAAFAVIPVVKDHLQAVDIGVGGYFFKHVGGHIRGQLKKRNITYVKAFQESSD